MYLSDSEACTKPRSNGTISELNSIHMISCSGSLKREHLSKKSRTILNVSSLGEKEDVSWCHDNSSGSLENEQLNKNSTRTQQELMPGEEKNNLDVRIIAAHLLDREMNNFNLFLDVLSYNFSRWSDNMKMYLDVIKTAAPAFALQLTEINTFPVTESVR